MDSDSDAASDGPGPKITNGIESDSDDDAPMIVHKKKRASVRIMDDSDEEDEQMQTFGNNSGSQSDSEQTSEKSSQKTQPMSNDGSSDNESDSENISIRKSPKSTQKRTPVLDDSDEESDAKESSGSASDSDGEASTNDKPSQKPSVVPSDSDSASDEEGEKKSQSSTVEMTDTVADTSVKAPSQVNGGLASDLFDAEMESDDDGKARNDSSDSDDDDQVCKSRDSGNSNDSDNNSEGGSRNSSGAENDDDDDGVTPEMSAALKRRLKKGAGKKASTPRSSNSGEGRRPKGEDIREIHSESQRLVRESAVRLPYHEPEKEKVSLSVFLARSKQKQEQLQSLKKPGLAWKTTPEILNKTKAQVSSASLPRTMDRRKKSTESPEKTQQTQSQATEEDSSKKDSTGIDSVKKDISKDLNNAEEDWDDLPDLIMEQATTSVQYEVVTAEEAEHSLALEKKSNEVKTVTDAIQEQESGYISVPTSEEENSGDLLKTNLLNSNSDCIQNENEVIKSVCLKNNDADIEALCTQPKNSMLTVENVPKDTLLTPKLASLHVDKFTPTLSGGPNSFIDFDDDDDSQEKKPSGVMKLMERVCQHSAKRHHAAGRDVEISLVSLEKGEKREELKLKKLTYHIDEEQEEDDAKTPGAKLMLLKEKLKDKMKQKREEARHKREELHAFDNEEGFTEAERMEEEAELTDETDTEDEDDEEDLIDEEEDLIGGHGNEEEDEEEKNPFVDNEADEDEDMDEDEDGLHLELDVADGEEEDDDEESSKPRKDFLQAALKKTKTLELFDEDANTESPTMSQNSNGCPLEISSRPFQQLSGQSEKTLTDGDPLATDDGDDDILFLDTQPIKNTDISSVQGLNRDKDTSLLSADSSFEMMGSYISAGQRTSKKNRTRDLITPDLLTPSSKSSATNSTIPKNASCMSTDLTMAVEDSQDLLTNGSPAKRVTIPQSQKSPTFDFHIEETQSLMLDDEGLFKVRSAIKPARRQLLLDTSTTGSASQDELLGLCSGKFMDDSQQTSGRESHTSKSLFGDSQSTVSSTQNNLDELLGLCSGRFTGRAPGLTQTQAQSQKAGDMQDDMENMKSLQTSLQTSLQAGTGPFVVVNSNKPAASTEDSPCKSPDKKSKKRKRGVIRDDNSNDSFEMVTARDMDEEGAEALDSDEEAVDDLPEEADDEQEQIDSDDEEMQQLKQFRGFTKGKKHGKIRQEFVDEEAELSGSECDSDENYDIADRDDMLELEEGDLDDVGTEEQLRNQVGRVHLKSVIDQDKKELRLFQEMYLQDGDMHSDGAGRQRKFRWRNIDEADTQQDMFGKSDDEDAEGDENHEEEAWRVKRFEREKFLNEQKENETKESDDVIKLGKVVFKPKKDKNSPFPVKESPALETEKKKVPEAVKENFAKPKLPVHGSFLRRSKDTLAKFAEMTKPIAAVGGARNSGKFVFSAVSPDQKEKEKEKEQKRPQVKRSISSSQQPNKRPRLERSNTLPSNSIFNLM